MHPLPLNINILRLLKQKLLTWNCAPGLCGASAKANIDDCQFVLDIINWMKNNCTFNNNAIFCTGLSNGGMMCYRVASHPEVSKYIRAIAPIAGSILYPAQFPSRSHFHY